MKYDSDEWREARNQHLQEWFGDTNAVDFIVTFGSICEVWDDIVDGDKVLTSDDVNRAFFNALIGLQVNPFFSHYRASIVPVLVSGINAWMDSNTYQKGVDESRQAYAYVLRDWYVEVAMLCVYLLHGYDTMREKSLAIREFFLKSETFQEYKDGLA